VVLGAGAALAVAVIATRDETPQTAAPRTARGAAAAQVAGGVPVPDVRLELLTGSPPKPSDVERNLFRFQSRPAPAAPVGPSASAGRAAAPPPATSAAPPSPPATALRYIGLLEAPSQAGRVAILSDGRGNVFYGREGDIIEGRYLMLQVGPDAAELSYLDGRGRQAIRLSGQ
jgi:hypothetical protein